MNQELLLEINQCLMERANNVKEIEELLNYEGIRGLMISRFRKYAAGLNLGFYDWSHDRGSSKLRLRDIEIQVPINRAIYLNGKMRFARSFIMSLVSRPNIEFNWKRLIHEVFDKSIKVESASFVRFIFVTREWGNLREYYKLEIDPYKNIGAEAIPEVELALRRARKGIMLDARKWQRVRDRMVSEAEPFLVGQMI
jgi:hypothetical protein